MHEYGEPLMSVETIGSSVYCRIPASGPLAADARQLAEHVDVRHVAARHLDQGLYAGGESSGGGNQHGLGRALVHGYIAGTNAAREGTS